MVIMHVLPSFSLLMEQATKGCVEELEVTRRDFPWGFYGSERTIDQDYTTAISIMYLWYVTFLINTLGLLLMAMLKERAKFRIVFVLFTLEIILPLLLVVTTIYLKL